MRDAVASHAVIDEHLRLWDEDRDARALSEAARLVDSVEARPVGSITAQVTVLMEDRELAAFSVCDAQAWEEAKLQGTHLGAAASLGLAGIARLDAQILGFEDSIIQKEIDAYYPEREAGALAFVPGALGGAHSLWAVRLEVAELVWVSAGRVHSHDIVHSVGWETETDEDGNKSLEKTHTTHWGQANSARGFFALGAPRWGGMDIVMDGRAAQRIGAHSPWLPVGKLVPGLELRADAAWNRGVGVAELGTDAAVEFDATGAGLVPVLAARVAGDIGAAGTFRESSATVRLGLPMRELGIDHGGDILAVQLQTGFFGVGRSVSRNADGPVPGVVAQAELALPIVAVLRVNGWAAVNRPDTVWAVPDATGRGEWGLRVYATYAL